jgi:hypothetical protein
MRKSDLVKFVDTYDPKELPCVVFMGTTMYGVYSS